MQRDYMADPHKVSVYFSPMGDWGAIAEAMMRSFERSAALWRDGWFKAMEIQSSGARALLAGPQLLNGWTVNLPYSGDVTQRIDPDTSWGVGASPDPQLERAIRDNVASYGRQIDWMLELLLDIAAEVDGTDPAKVERLRALKERIELMKGAARPPKA